MRTPVASLMALITATCDEVRGHLADAGRAEGTVLAWRLDVVEVELVRDVAGEGQTAGEHRSVLVEVFEVLGQRQADALGDAAVHLAVHHQPVVDLADVGDGRVSLHTVALPVFMSTATSAMKTPYM